MADKKDVKKKSFGEGIVKYFKSVKSEMKKVVWPTFKQVKNNTIIVLIAILLVGILIWALDFVFQNTLSKAVEKYGNNAPAASGSVDFTGDGTTQPINIDSEDATIPEDGAEETGEDVEAGEDADAGEEDATAEEGAAEEAETAEDAADAGADKDGE